MTSFFQCGVCDYWRRCDAPGDRDCVDVDKGLMLEHYKWVHADLIGVKHTVSGVAFSDYYVWGPIPEHVGPSFYDHGLGVTYTWRAISYWGRKSGSFRWSSSR